MSRTTLVLALTLLAPTPAFANVFDAEATISQVTVYRDLAEIVRSTELELPAGPVTVVFRDLPEQTEHGSLLARTTDDGVRVGMVTLDLRVEDLHDAEKLGLREEIALLEDTVAEIEMADEITGSLREYLRGVLASSASLEGSKVFEGGGEPEVILAVYEMARLQLTELARNQLERRPRLRRLEGAMARARSRLQELDSAGLVQHRDVRVELELDRSGPIELELGYAVKSASWSPTYRAELDTDGERLQFVTEAVVTQSTGEDWDGVQLHLSSASPSSQLAPPQLGSWWLKTAATDARNVDPLTGKRMNRVNPNSIEQMEVLPAAGGAAFSRAQGGFSRISARPGPSGYTVTFSVPGRVKLETGGRARRVTLRSEELEADLVYRAVPSKDQRVFMVVNTLSPADYPLLAGMVRVYNGAAFLGSSRLAETGPGAKLSLPFGVDNRIELTYVPSRFEARGGWSGKQRQLSRSARTLIHNLHDRTVSLIVEAQIPVAQDDRIEIQLARRTTPGHTPSEHRPGVLLWELELGPGENRELELSYDVRHPTDVTLQATR